MLARKCLHVDLGIMCRDAPRLERSFTMIRSSRSPHRRTMSNGIALSAALLSFGLLIGCEPPADEGAVNPEIQPSEQPENSPSRGATAGTGGNSTLGKAKNAASNLAERMEEKSKEIADQHGDPYDTDR